MWPRVSELFLGGWLMVSPLVFRATAGAESFVGRDLIVGMVVVLLSLMSFWRRPARAHLLTAVLSVGLWGMAYFGWPRPGPPAAQNEIATALFLLMLAIIPNNANRPPVEWRGRSE